MTGFAMRKQAYKTTNFHVVPAMNFTGMSRILDSEISDGLLMSSREFHNDRKTGIPYLKVRSSK